VSIDPIDAHLRKLRRRWWWRRNRDRRLVEAEDHLRSASQDLEWQGFPHEQAMSEAVTRYGFPPTHQTRWGLVSVAGLLTAAALIVALAPTTDSHRTMAMKPSNRPVAAAMREAADGGRSEPGFPIPARTRIDASAPVPTADAAYVFFTYTSRRWRCEGDYLAAPGGLAPLPRLRSAGSSCEPVGSRERPIDLQIQGCSGQPFILSGTVPQTADELAITTPGGRTVTYLLPHISLHADRQRQAVILDLSAEHIRGVGRLALLMDGHTLASQTQGAA
jgi:hypothetical protein